MNMRLKRWWDNETTTIEMTLEEAHETKGPKDCKIHYGPNMYCLESWVYCSMTKEWYWKCVCDETGFQPGQHHT